METRIASLEAALAQLSFEFAEKLLAIAVSAPVRELAALLRDGRDLEREVLRLAATKLKAEPPVARPSSVRAASPAVAPVPRAPRPKARPRAPLPRVTAATRPTFRARGVGGSARFDEAEEGDSFANAITDPSLLLEVLSTARPAAESEPAAAPEGDTEDEATPVLHAARDVAVPAPRDAAPKAAADHGPALRPGESLQRTARGGVVLRRGAR